MCVCRVQMMMRSQQKIGEQHSVNNQWAQNHFAKNGRHHREMLDYKWIPILKQIEWCARTLHLSPFLASKIIFHTLLIGPNFCRQPHSPPATEWLLIIGRTPKQTQILKSQRWGALLQGAWTLHLRFITEIRECENYARVKITGAQVWLGPIAINHRCAVW